MFCDVMVQGMSRDTWDDFSKTILMRYLLSYLCGTLYMDLSASLKRSLHSLWGEGGGGGLFGLSTHALTLTFEPYKAT